MGIHNLNNCLTGEILRIAKGNEEEKRETLSKVKSDRKSINKESKESK